MLVSVLWIAGILAAFAIAVSVSVRSHALHVRNTISDAAAEGARWGALADSSLDDGVARTTELIDMAVGEGYARDVAAGYSYWRGQPAIHVTVHAALPVIGLWGPGIELEVTGHAAREVVG